MICVYMKFNFSGKRLNFVIFNILLFSSMGGQRMLD